MWRLLGAREVWFWAKGELSFHVLRDERYVQATRSTILPGLDPEIIVRCMGEASQTEAVKALRRAMRAGKRSKKR